MIRIIAADANTKGDLFADRMSDLMHAIGFNIERKNIHKSGRELDLVARHRLEGRVAIAECKAWTDKVGGAEINKFVGTLDAERRRRKGHVIGYFISLSGFKDSAIEQEDELDNDRCVLLDGVRIAEELQRARVLVPLATAMTRAARISPSTDWAVSNQGELLATLQGWIWLIWYTSGGGRVAYTLIHADGEALPPDEAAEISQQLPDLHAAHLHSVQPTNSPSDLLRAYKRFVITDNSRVTHEGLPADATVGQTLQLDKIFVPLELERWREERPSAEREDSHHPNASEPTSRIIRASELTAVTLAEAIAENRQISVLGAPGCGKSTLLRRIAIAFADRQDTFRKDAGLPEADLLPVLIRCRDAESARTTILNMIEDLPDQLSRPDARSTFLSLVMEALRRGSVILLVDGLDEIPTAQSRIAFVRNLRNFLTTYPQTYVIITSREPGYRPVAGVLAEHCKNFRLLDLSPQSVRELVHRWNELVPYRSAKSSRSPDSLADKIQGNDRLRRLASNPLLLTTLLLVERWVGDLPRKRSILYDKAIEVLLITWNVEGHKSLDLDEVLPQLAYVAHEMTAAGQQRISSNKLVSLLEAARRDMPDVLSYAKFGPRELLDRIELRSSLISQAGHTVEDGRLQATYEFKHLTFQEYLTALACVQGWTSSGATTATNPTSVLRQHYEDPTWREVITLAVVLSRRVGEGIVLDIIARVHRLDEELLELSTSEDGGSFDEKYQCLLSCVDVLLSCLHDEAAIRPDIAKQAIRIWIEFGPDPDVDMYAVSELLSTKFANDLRIVVEEGCRIGGYPQEYCTVAASICEHDFYTSSPRPLLTAYLQERLAADDIYKRVEGCSFLVNCAYNMRQVDPDHDLVGFYDMPELEVAVSSSVEQLLVAYEQEDVPPSLTLAAAWALNWVLDDAETPDAVRQRVLDRACVLALDHDHHPAADYASWGIVKPALVERDRLSLQLNDSRLRRIRSMFDGAKAGNFVSHQRDAALVLAFLSGVADSQTILHKASTLDLPEAFFKRLEAVLRFE